MSAMNFEGFSKETLFFLNEVTEKNSKIWFEENRQIYEQSVLNPMRSLVSELGEIMLAIDQEFEIRPAINKTISKIFRDTRFSKDKSLFRKNMWITFKRPGKNWQDAPAYYFEITPDSYGYGMGFYQAKRDTMDAFRKRIDEYPEEFRNAISFYSDKNIYELKGERYKRKIPNDHPAKIQEWYQFKNFYLVCNKKIDDALFSKELVNELIFSFMMLKPLYEFIMNAKTS